MWGGGGPGELWSDSRLGATASAAVAGVAALILALALTPRVLGIGDSAEFTLVLAVAGVPHPTGYPWYVLVGSPFVRALHAVGVDWVRAAAAFSAVGAALATALIVLAGARLRANAGDSRGVAFLVPALLATLHPVWLQAATMAEVYTWWYAWVALASWVALGALQHLDAGPMPRSIAGAAFRWGLLCGIGLAHHAASAFFVLPLTIALALGVRRAGGLRAGAFGAALAGVALPLGAYGFLWWRAHHDAAFQWPIQPSIAGVLAHARGAAYAFYVGKFAPSPDERALISRTIVPLLAPGLLGTALYALRSGTRALRHGLLALLTGAALLVAFIVNYGVPDPSLYFVPAMVVGLLGAAPAFAALERRVPSGLARVLLAAVVLTVFAWSVRGTLDENRRRVLADARIRAAWDRIPYRRAIVLWWDDDCTRLKLHQILGGEKPGLYVENPNWLTWPVARAAFQRRFGFDPLEGFEVRDRTDPGRLPDHIRARASLPVLDFNAVLDWGTAP